MALLKESEHDRAIANAMEAAAAAGVPVIQPALLEHQVVRLPESQALRDAGIAWLHPVEQVDVVPYHRPDEWGEAIRGRVAIVGSHGGQVDLHRTPDGPRYGVEMQAALVETLLRQASLQVVRPETNALVALLTGVLTTASALRLRAVRTVILLVPLASLAVCLSLMAAGIVVSWVPIVLAGCASWWVLRDQVD